MLILEGKKRKFRCFSFFEFVKLYFYERLFNSKKLIRIHLSLEIQNGKISI